MLQAVGGANCRSYPSSVHLLLRPLSSKFMKTRHAFCGNCRPCVFRLTLSHNSCIAVLHDSLCSLHASERHLLFFRASLPLRSSQGTPCPPVLHLPLSQTAPLELSTPLRLFRSTPLPLYPFTSRPYAPPIRETAREWPVLSVLSTRARGASSTSPSASRRSGPRRVNGCSPQSPLRARAPARAPARVPARVTRCGFLPLFPKVSLSIHNAPPLYTAELTASPNHTRLPR